MVELTNGHLTGDREAPILRKSTMRACPLLKNGSDDYDSAHVATSGTAASRTPSNVATCGPY
jgi:hypothetical protein